MAMRAIKRIDSLQVLSLIDETLKSTTSEGFPPERVASILHKIELSLKHQQSNFGLAILLGLIAKWNHIQDPTNHLQINQLIDKLKAEMKECPRLFEDMVEKYFLQNPHVLVAQMTPDPDFEKREKAAEEALLRSKVEALGAEERKEVLKMAEALQKQQNQEEDLSVLPILKISEIERTVEAVEMEDIAIDDIQFKVRHDMAEFMNSGRRERHRQYLCVLLHYEEHNVI
ncbi:unnamed protein product [Cyprideis torosa]|uniref:Peptidase M16C associated domain-containing protein n=1 Tax=Cyprideis torosa TaxID=163714 RepID=A0A7R8WKS4_9CRUS|nr:unnamed protein product [Cyprideis torosa]CAG0903534.1 unnamed protein product [Cyprideis torosa]